MINEKGWMVCACFLFHEIFQIVQNLANSKQAFHGKKFRRKKKCRHDYSLMSTTEQSYACYVIIDKLCY